MSIKFSPELFHQLGGQSWTPKPECFQKTLRIVDDAALDVSTTEIHRPVENPVPQSHAQATVETIRVFIVDDLDEIWQNEESLAWQLWGNIQKALGWDESQIEFFDVATMVSEESMQDCMETLMELPIDQVFVMFDDDHPLIEMLQEGLEVLRLPSLDEMLENPYAKQRFYQSVIQYA